MFNSIFDNCCQMMVVSKQHDHHLATVVKSTITHLVNDTNSIWQQLSSTIKKLVNSTTIIWQQLDGRAVY
jgi:hypothetical protein